MIELSDRLKPEKKKSNGIKDRLKKATALVRQIDERDAVYFNGDKTICIIKLFNISFLSYNDLLRLDNRSIYSFKMAWHNRLRELFKSVDMTDWIKHNSEEKLVEFVYQTKNSQTYDADAIVSAFKSTLDGMVDVGLLEDDDKKNLPIIIPRQEKNKGESNLFIVVSALKDIREYYTETFKEVIDDKI